jgi:hypothetical protein
MGKSERTGQSRGQQAAGRKMAATAADRAGAPEERVTGRLATDDIARRAYELYRARGGEHGADVEDWLQAERELRGR